MYNSIDQDQGNIILKERNEIKSSEVTLGYIINELKLVHDLKHHNYDISLYSAYSTKLNFKFNKKGLGDLLYQENILSINKIYSLKLYDLSVLGFIPDPQTGDTYDYIKLFVDSINYSIDMDERNNLEFASDWKKMYEYNKDKFTKEQLKNNIGISGLYKIKSRFGLLAKKIESLLINENIKSEETFKQSLRNEIDNLNKFFEKETLFKINSDEANRSEFNKTLNMNHFPCHNPISIQSTETLMETLYEYYYVLKNYYRFLNVFLEHIKKERIKLATEVFNTNSTDYKIHCLDAIPEEDYQEFFQFNITNLYDYFRMFIVNRLNMIIDKGIILRKRVDLLFQILPNTLGLVLFSFIMILYSQYHFTLLKEIWVRYRIFNIYLWITVCALCALINLYRNSIQFKRPKRSKYQRQSLRIFLGLSILTYILGAYFINRYDGYNDTYYYINNSSQTITIDGLVGRKQAKYVIPDTIDGLSVSIVSRNAFRWNRHIKEVDFRTSSANLDVSVFDGASNLETVYLSDNINVIPKNSFRNNFKLKNLVSTEILEIHGNAFYNCYSLGNIDLSKAIQIDSYAFFNCVNLRHIEFSTSLTTIKRSAFENCEKMTFDYLPESVTHIESRSFFNCNSLNQIILSRHVRKIGKNAFGGINNLQNIEINDFRSVKNGNLEYVFGSHSLRNTKTMILKNINRIKSRLLKNSTSLENITIQGSFRVIEREAFYGLRSLRSVNIQGTITKIEDKAFFDCVELTEVSVDNNAILAIGKQAFYNCIEFMTPLISENLASIGSYAFYNNKSLESVVIPSNVKKIGKQAFYGTENIKSISLYYLSPNQKLSDYFDTKGLEKIETVTLKNAKTIPNYFFDGLTSLRNLTIQGNPTKIGNYAFRNNHSLVQFQIPESVSTIGRNAFQNCIELEQIIIPKNVIKVKRRAFENCKSVQSVVVHNKNITLESQIFFGVTSITSVEMPATSWFIINYQLDRYFDYYSLSKIQSLKLTNVKTLPSNYFQYTRKVNTVQIDGDLDIIREKTFKDLGYLKKVILPNGIIRIKNSAFMNCVELEEINIPQSVKIIDHYTFSGCTKMTAIDLPDEVRFMGKYVFYGTNITINNTDEQPHIDDWDKEWNTR